MLKKSLAVMGFAVLVLVAVVSAQNAKLDFNLVNKTGVDIHAIYISPSDVNEWQEDVLDFDVLSDGETLKVQFDIAESVEMWDLKVEDEDGTAIIWEDLDLSEVNVLILKIVDGKPIAEIK